MFDEWWLVLNFLLALIFSQLTMDFSLTQSGFDNLDLVQGKLFCHNGLNL